MALIIYLEVKFLFFMIICYIVDHDIYYII